MTKELKLPGTQAKFAAGALVVAVLAALVGDPEAAALPLLLAILWGTTAAVRAYRIHRHVQAATAERVTPS